jgi:hypothetical protein
VSDGAFQRKTINFFCFTMEEKRSYFLNEEERKKVHVMNCLSDDKLLLAHNARSDC